ncbi:HORMA domain [Popillia japonica]|uniref:HORMA domain n=1 Tax=Popillia japonica TaxID=7064 RepID=A0AAW1ISZ7_POPJA
MSGQNDISTDIACEFFEVIIHNILYVRKLYPHQIFKKTKKYGTVVYQLIHPEVRDYITKCLKAIHFYLKSNCLKTICICILTKDHIIERYLFNLLHIQNNVEDLYISLEQSFHDFCLKLHINSNKLDELPDEATFIINLCVSEYNSVEFNENNDFAWIQVNLKELPKAEVVPMYSIDTSTLKIQSYIEKIQN